MWKETLKANYECKEVRGQIVLRVCPFCSNDKWNLEISIAKKVYHCWVCHSSGTVVKFFHSVGLSFTEDEGWRVTGSFSEEIKDDLDIAKFTHIDFEQFVDVFSVKGISRKDVYRYNLLYANSGKFNGKMVIPLYEGKKLVYAIARDLAKKGKYYNFKLDKSMILPYYLGSIRPLVIHLCEGVLDAMVINKLGFTSGVLLGTHLSVGQIDKLRKFGFKKAVVCLDGDAIAKAIKIYDELNKAGVVSEVVFITNKQEDPNDVFVRDREELCRLINSSRRVTVLDRAKVGMHL